MDFNSKLDQVFIIAEAGNNHEGDFACAVDMIQAASESGADAVKFQTINPAKLVQQSDKQRLETLEKFRFTIDQFARLAEEAASKEILFLSTPFDLESVELLAPLVPAYKVASGDNTFYPLLEKIAATKKPVILSTGMLDLEGVSKSVSVITDTWKEHAHEGTLALLHCVVSYPAQEQDINMRALHALSSLGYPVGYSDHTIGNTAAVTAVALGARVIEKHFTLDKQQSSFRDHALSADPDDLAALVSAIRSVERILGQGGKMPADCELPMMTAIRRFVTARTDLVAGHVLGVNDLEWLRGAAGAPASDTSLMLGKRLKEKVEAGAPITLAMLEA